MSYPCINWSDEMARADSAEISLFIIYILLHIYTHSLTHTYTHIHTYIIYIYIFIYPKVSINESKI